MNTDKKEILFFKRYSEEMTSEEEVKVHELLAASDENQKEMDLVKQIIFAENEIKELASYDVSVGYQNMMQKVKSHPTMNHWRLWLTRVAAILVLPLLISTFTLMHINNEQQKELNNLGMIEVLSAPGMVSTFELPDKSKVWLNSGSRLRYPSRFAGNTREVELNGEGYFEVKSDKENPFYVSTGSGVKIMAHGTHFNVDAYDDNDNVEAVLAEGQIDFLLSDKKLSQLKPGEQAVLNKSNNQLAVRPVSVYEKIAWKDGKIVFRNASLEEVFKQLGRRYNVDIIFHDDYRLSAGYRCRVTFTNETLQQIFSYLEIAAPIKWRVNTLVQQSDSTLVKQRVDVWLKKK